MSRAAILLILAGCSQQEAIERLKRDLPVDSIEIVHARFPCRSPEMHFFGYRFRAWSKGQGALGDICWSSLTREWSGAAWAKNPRVLAGRLRRAQTFLRTLGIEITFSREGRTGTRMIRVSTSPHNSVSAVSIVSAGGTGSRPGLA
jgi:hypothetical protein